MRLSPFSLLIVAAIVLVPPVRAGSILITFDTLGDLEPVTNQFLGTAGVTFSNATILTSGISLNELEFPPVSDPNVVVDDGGPISIAFATPASSFAGFFTYTVPLMMTAFDSAHSPVNSTTSAYSNNLAISGDPGSHPNEFLEVSFSGGISRITISGDQLGGSFVLDNATIGQVPEPAASALVSLGLLALAGVRRTLHR